MSAHTQCAICDGLGRIADIECWNCRELPVIDADEYLRGYIDGAEHARNQSAVRELAVRIELQDEKRAYRRLRVEHNQSVLSWVFAAVLLTAYGVWLIMSVWSAA